MIVVVVLMVLLTLLTVGLLGLSTTVVRGHNHEEARNEARANARLALQMAIAQLQETLGPDQRITAPATLSGVPGMRAGWTGVWTPGALSEESGVITPAVGYGEDFESDRYLSDNRNRTTDWREQWFLKPLVSEVKSSGIIREAVIMPQSGTAPEIRVPEILVGDTGTLAWWTEDLSQKASLAAGRNATQAGPEALASAPRMNAGAFATEANLVPDFFQDSAAREKSLTVPQMYLAANTAPPAVGRPDLTPRSYGLFTDPVRGGFKGDLTTYLDSSEEVIGDEPTMNLVGIANDRSILPQPFHREAGPRWGRAKSWYELGRDIGASGTTSAMRPDVVRRAEVPCGEGFSIDAVRGLNQPLHPMIVDAGFSWDFTPEDQTNSAVLCHIFPRVSLWNPYNVTLESNEMVVSMPKDCDEGGGLSLEVSRRGRSDIISLVVGNRGAHLRDDTYTGRNRPEDFYFHFKIPATTFGPGECLVFTPLVSGNTGMQPYDTINVSNNVMTAAQPIGSENFTLRFPINNAELERALLTGSEVTRYLSAPGADNSHVNRLNWIPKPFFLKETGSENFTRAEVLASPEFVTLQRLYVNNGGGGAGYFSPQGSRASFVGTQPEWSDHPANAGSPWIPFAPGRLPPRRWNYRIHLGWVDDFEELVAIGRLNNPEPPYQSAVFADWNPLASIVCRTPSTYIGNILDLHTGPWYLSKAPQPAFGGDSTWGTFIDGMARGCPNANPLDFAQELSFPAIDLPDFSSLPLQGLGQLRHAVLSPFLWHPIRAVGSSRPSLHAEDSVTSLRSIADDADPWSKTIVERDAVFSDIVQTEDHADTLLYDFAYLLNNSLWDSYFASSWQDSSASNLSSLPNALYDLHPSNRPNLDALSDLHRENPNFALWLPAYLLVNEGAFNVNSTSVPAWEALLGGLKDVERPIRNGEEPDADHLYARFRSPLTSEGLWSGVLSLSDAEITTLAAAIVEVVNLRGPFLGVSDFINRQLSTGLESRTGALDEAITQSGLFSGEARAFENNATDDGTLVPQSQRVNQESASDFLLRGAPSALEQGDLLEPLGGSLCARGDSFRIRAVGTSLNLAGQVIAREICEATVVRSPEYIHSAAIETPGSTSAGNSALLPPTIPVAGTSTPQANPLLNPQNQRFGRRFEILEVQWLPHP